MKHDETQAMLRLYRQGKTVREIAALYGLHYTSVAERLRRAGAPLRRRGKRAVWA